VCFNKHVNALKHRRQAVIDAGGGPSLETAQPETGHDGRGR
jgi:hypothetical protein